MLGSGARRNPSSRAGGAVPPARLRTAFPNWIWIVLVPWSALVYWLSNFGWPATLEGGLNTYLAQPLTWSSLGLLGYLGWRFGLEERPAPNRTLLAVAAFTGLFQVTLLILGGLIAGLGYSPYGHRPLILLGNLVFVGSILVGVELARAYVISSVKQYGPLLALVASGLFFAVLSIPAGRLGSIIDLPSLFQVSGDTILPALSESFFASLLVYLGGPLASIAYRTVPLAFEWLSPVLPNLSWPMKAFVGTIAPVVGMMVVLHGAEERSAAAEAEPARTHSQIFWVRLGLAGVVILWFNSGLFGVHPTVVSGVSMEPALVAGDLVITQEVGPEQVEVGDIVRFRTGETYILHRVVEAHDTGSGWVFVTKGDANNVLDGPLVEQQIDGKVILRLPKVGWLSIGVRRVLGFLG